jgi:hypothetical protein
MDTVSRLHRPKGGPGIVELSLSAVGFKLIGKDDGLACGDKVGALCVCSTVLAR